MPKIRDTVETILADSGVTSAPVPVEKIAADLGAEIRFSLFDGDVSGMFFRKDGTSIIGVNAKHPPNRQRFTIAHEIAHLVLHPQGDLFVDSGFKVYLRGDGGDGTPEQEREANQFAAELLMPTHFIKQDVACNFDIESDEQINELSKKYKVSNQAMAIRLGRLIEKL